MKNILSVFFSPERTYISVIGEEQNKLFLNYINSTTLPFDFNEPESESSVKASEELQDLLQSVNIELSSAVVTLPSELSTVRLVPSSQDITQPEINEMLDLEIRQAYPDSPKEDFITEAVRLLPDIKGKKRMMFIITPKKFIEKCSEILGLLNLPVTKSGICQLNAHNAFLFNYADNIPGNHALINIKKGLYDISILSNGKPVYYNLASLSIDSNVANVLTGELSVIMENFVPYIDSAYFFGTGLTKDLLTTINSELSGTVKKVNRFNAFRMFSTALGETEKNYAARAAHIFPPCIGAGLPVQSEYINLAE